MQKKIVALALAAVVVAGCGEESIISSDPRENLMNALAEQSCALTDTALAADYAQMEQVMMEIAAKYGYATPADFALASAEYATDLEFQTELATKINDTCSPTAGEDLGSEEGIDAMQEEGTEPTGEDNSDILAE